MNEIKEMPNQELVDFMIDDTESPLTPMGKEGFAELLSRLRQGQKAIAAMKQIGDLVYNCSCHADTSNEVTKIFMEYEK